MQLTGVWVGFVMQRSVLCLSGSKSVPWENLCGCSNEAGRAKIQRGLLRTALHNRLPFTCSQTLLYWQSAFLFMVLDIVLLLLMRRHTIRAPFYFLLLFLLTRLLLQLCTVPKLNPAADTHCSRVLLQQTVLSLEFDAKWQPRTQLCYITEGESLVDSSFVFLIWAMHISTLDCVLMCTSNMQLG